METQSREYKEHLEKKYLPFRDKYLQLFFYPKIAHQFSSDKIIDLGCGTGEFLKFLSMKGRQFSGIDNNPYLVQKCREMGFDVQLDDVTRLSTIVEPVQNAIIDNVLEHLELQQIDLFFGAAKAKMAHGGILVVIVPDKKGYKYDPTHRTFVNKEIISSMCTKNKIELEDDFSHPIDLRIVGNILYLNMQVFKIRF
jgi:trans-aconitate methyltransferase